MKIGQVMIHVSTLENAKKFYVDILGLKIQTDLSSELGMLIMENEGCIFTIHSGYTPKETDWKDCKSTIMLSVPNIQDARNNLVANKVTLEGDIIETPAHKYQLMKDFDQNWIEVAEFK